MNSLILYEQCFHSSSSKIYSYNICQTVNNLNVAFKHLILLEFLFFFCLCSEKEFRLIFLPVENYLSQKNLYIALLPYLPAVVALPHIQFNSVQFSSVAQSCPTLCNPMNRSTPGLPVHHQLPEFTQTHVHRVSDAIQPSHPLSSPSPPAPNPSQHQSLFQ